jgi:hypothetical protein
MMAMSARGRNIVAVTLVLLMAAVMVLPACAGVVCCKHCSHEHAQHNGMHAHASELSAAVAPVAVAECARCEMSAVESLFPGAQVRGTRGTRNIVLAREGESLVSVADTFPHFCKMWGTRADGQTPRQMVMRI